MAIPAYIKTLSYIRGSGDQYITTDIHLRSTDVVKSKWRFANNGGNVYGCFSGSSENDNFCLYAGSSSTNAYIRYNGQMVRDFKATSDTIYEIEQGPDGFKTAGVNASFTPATFTCSAPMYIFMLPNSTSAKVTARFYGLRIYRDGALAYNFIPAQNTQLNEVGMWESVNGVWYSNAGTGEFTTGPETVVPLKSLLLKRRRGLMAAAKKYERPPGGDGMVWAYYDVTSTESATKVFNSTDLIDGSYMYVDGVRVAKATTYLFNTTGRHLIKFQFKQGSSDWTQFFSGVPKLEEIHYPAITFTISYRCFKNCTGLTKVSFYGGASVSLRGEGGQFEGCSALTSLSLPITMSTNVPSTTFSGATQLSTIEFTGSGTLAISTNDPFNTTKTPNLDKVVFGPNYTALTGRLAYSSAITKMIVLATTPPGISASSTAFLGWNVAHKIFVPYSSDHSILNAYKAHTNWSAQSANIYELNPDGTIPTA